MSNTVVVVPVSVWKSKPCMTNAQLGYNELFSSWFSESLSPFYQNALNLKEFILDVIIQALLPFCRKEFVDLGFQVSIGIPEWNWFEFWVLLHLTKATLLFTHSWEEGAIRWIQRHLHEVKRKRPHLGLKLGSPIFTSYSDTRYFKRASYH